MNSVMSRSALGRRVIPGTVLALAAATLSLGAGSAGAVTTVDLEGTVRGVGNAPVANVRVYAYDATKAPDSVGALDSVLTDVNGHYLFDTLNFDGTVKVRFDDENAFTLTSTSHYLRRWNGGSRYFAGAPAVTVATDGDTTLDATLPQAAILLGDIRAQDGHALDAFDFDLVNSDDEWGNVVRSADDGVTFRIAAEPGVLRLGGYGWDKGADATWSTLDDISYLETWWRSADLMGDATGINAVSGQIVSGLSLRVTSALTARQAPSISGIAAVGRPLTASPGTWSRNAGTEFSYTWLLGDVVVGTGPTYTPDYFNQRFHVLVRALNGVNAGQAVSALTDPSRWPADAHGRAKALAGHKARFAVRIVSAKQSPVRGKVVVLRGTKVVHAAVKLVKGKAVIIVKGQPKGKQIYTVLYKGNKLLSKAMKNFTVRVR